MEVTKKRGVPSAASSRSVRGLGKGVSGKPYPRLCNARRPRLEPGTFRSHAVRLYRLHQARPSKKISGPLKCRIFVASHSKLLLDSQQIGYKQGSPHLQHPAHYMIKHLKTFNTF